MANLEIAPHGPTHSDGTVDVGSGRAIAQSPDRITNLRESWARLGKDPGAFDASIAASGRPPALPTLEAPTGADPATRDRVKFYNGLLAAGWLPPAKVLAAAAKDGLEIGEPAEAASDEAQAFDTAFAAPADPSQYLANHYEREGLRLETGLEPEQFDTVDQALSKSAQAFGLNESLGKSFIKEILDTHKGHASRSPQEHEQWAQGQLKQLKAIYGDRHEEISAEVLQAVRALPEDLGEVFANGGMSAQAIMMAHLGLQRLALRGRL